MLETFDFDGDKEALDALAGSPVTQHRGTLTIPRAGEHRITPRQWAAVQYLSDEWDYDWQRVPALKDTNHDD